MNSQVKVKLPKLELKPFHGDIIDWKPFWDKFNASIHSNNLISKIEKFSYLKTFLNESASNWSYTKLKHCYSTSNLFYSCKNKVVLVQKPKTCVSNLNETKNPYCACCSIHEVRERFWMKMWKNFWTEKVIGKKRKLIRFLKWVYI